MKKISPYRVSRLLTAVILLVGCDQLQKATDSVHNPIVELPSGWKMNNHGRLALVTGKDSCLDNRGQPANETGCVIFSKQVHTTEVKVIDAGSGEQHTETWVFESKGDAGGLVRRPDKSFVAAWKD